ncbi:hypothetical protein [Streptomyces sp. CB02460]|uniref:hypothetical protein n=1 Tax=Streptomyces sp. CB02460 TaxID=1703941 RepID=UPI00093B71AB|nr:hypothetical protein [Streptomyces sp. CB02460]OKJ74229.1 hypothetical protein AMK30_17250 [Streptomyces sp. CB02460]
MGAQGTEQIVLLTIDRETETVVFTRSDGKEARFPLERPLFQEASALTRLHVSGAFDVMVAETTYGDAISFDLPTTAGTEPLQDRLVVYLDQNKWSEVANSLYAPEKVSTDNRSASARLIQLVRERRIVLPASAGHYAETGKRFSTEKRYQLALTILQQSRGWQMRDPLEVRQQEIRSALLRHSGDPSSERASAVFTLAPDSLYSAARGYQGYVPPAGLPPEQALALTALTNASASIDTMLDAERVGPGAEGNWAAHNQRFSDWLDGEPRDTQQKRKSIDAFLLSDIGREAARVAHAMQMSPAQFDTWIRQKATKDISSLPSLGLFREVFHTRHLNRATTWRINDCTDMMYLSCAAAYADFVVCERHMREHLSHGLRRMKSGTQVFRHLHEVVDAIEERWAQPERP